MLVCFMHTEQNYHFPAVCFWKDLISDAVKYWFSLTSVKALIFLLGLDIKNFQTRLFLAFWASIKFLLMISHFPHIAMSLFMPSSWPLPTSYGCCWCFSKSLELGISLWLQEVQWRWSWKLTSQLFLWLHSLLVERVEKSSSPQSLLEELRKHPGLGERDSNKFSAHHKKDLTYRKCSIVLFVVALMSTWLDNRCPSPSISHSSSMSPVLER